MVTIQYKIPNWYISKSLKKIKSLNTKGNGNASSAFLNTSLKEMQCSLHILFLYLIFRYINYLSTEKSYLGFIVM